MSYMERGDSRNMFARRRAALDVWVKVIGVMRALKSAGDKELYVPVSGGRYVFTGSDFLD